MSDQAPVQAEAPPSEPEASVPDQAPEQAIVVPPSAPKASVRQSNKKLNASLIGGSGMTSNMRSSVTKSFNRASQGGFDERDRDKGIEQVVKMSSSRPASAVALVSSMMGPPPTIDEEAQEAETKYCCGCLCSAWNGIPITNNTKALFVMMILFAVISLAQYFAADAVKSQALKADVISMAVDALSYLGNIFGESAESPAQRIVTQLFFSMVSLVLLVYFNSTTFVESLELFNETKSEDYVMSSDDVSSEGIVVITFAGLGLVFDAVSLYAYKFYAQKDADREFEAMQAELTELEKTGEDAAKIQKPAINMLSALLHVSADLFRSTSTFVLGVLMVSGALNPKEQDQGDAILALIIGGTIYFAAVYALYEWWGSFSVWFSSLSSVQMEEEKEGVGNILLG